MKRSQPLRKKRPGTRRGQPTPAEKEAMRNAVYEACGGRCELRLVPQCSGERVLPKDGSVFERWHLVHARAKRRFGWPLTGPYRLRGGCWACHRAVHDGRAKINIELEATNDLD